MIYFTAILTIFAIFISWRIYRSYDIALNAYSHLMSTLDIIEAVLKVNTPLSIALKSENIFWLAHLHKDKYIIKKLFRNNDIDQCYNKLFEIIKTLNLNDSKINSDITKLKSDMPDRVNELMNEIENNSVLSLFIIRPLLYFSPTDIRIFQNSLQHYLIIEHREIIL